MVLVDFVDVVRILPAFTRFCFTPTDMLVSSLVLDYFDLIVSFTMYADTLVFVFFSFSSIPARSNDFLHVLLFLHFASLQL